MPGRKVPLKTGMFYHIYNRGVDKMPIFIDIKSYVRAIGTMNYYAHRNIKMKYSDYCKLSDNKKQEILDHHKRMSEYDVDIVCYCFMPNHYHLLLKQRIDGGISRHISRFTNSYTKYFNTRKRRIGPLFQGVFSNKLISTEEQLLYVSRYIHRNPYVAGNVKDIGNMIMYPFSSMQNYIKSDFCIIRPDYLLGKSRNIGDYISYVVTPERWKKRK